MAVDPSLWMRGSTWHTIVGRSDTTMAMTWKTQITSHRRWKVCRSTSRAEGSLKPLQEALEAAQALPPSQRSLPTSTAGIDAAMKALAEEGVLRKWNLAMENAPRRRSLFARELKQATGLEDTSAIARPSARNDAVFLAGVVGGSSIAAVLAGALLPGQIGFWGQYLIGGISIAVLAIGSTAPGLLQAGIERAGQIFPEYRERVVRHEAAHFLIAYLLGVPIAAYSLEMGRQHVDLAQAALQRQLLAGRLEDEELDRLALVAMAGVAGECNKFQDVMGQTADLMDLQRMMNRSDKKLSDSEQQNLTRWAVYQACTMLKQNQSSYDALVETMKKGGSVYDCIKAIEDAKN